MHKVVYNSCYGGFDLSDEAYELYKKYGGKSDSSWFILDRHEPALIRVVEELGEKANGSCANLKIEEIEGNKYYIEEYDGAETVITPESEIFITIED